jgi:hypothetical protein
LPHNRNKSVTRDSNGERNRNSSTVDER